MWHNYKQMVPLFDSIFERIAAETGLTFDNHHEPLGSIEKSLQLARQSQEMPDLHTLAGLKIPVTALHKDGWFHPLDLGDAADRLPEGSQIEGLHVFDGTTYSFPFASFRQYWAPVWYLEDVVAKADLDPDDPPRTWDEFRQACRQVTKSSGEKMYGWTSKLAVANGMAPEMLEIAQAAGFEGAEGVDFRSGEYAYHSDPIVETVEFLRSLHTDGLMFPGSMSMDPHEGPLRWMSGSSAYWMDGPWLPGVVDEQQDETLSERLRVAPILVPDREHEPTVYHGPNGGGIWISDQSEHPDECSDLLAQHFTTKEFFVGVAESSAVPADLSVVPDADVHPMYQKLITWYAQDVFLAPSAVVRNPEVSKVTAEMRQVKPDLGAILQGFFSGDVTDLRAALKKLSDDSMAERERALEKVAKEGVSLSQDDWAFPNWTPRKDYAS